MEFPIFKSVTLCSIRTRDETFGVWSALPRHSLAVNGPGRSATWSNRCIDWSGGHALNRYSATDKRVHSD